MSSTEFTDFLRKAMLAVRNHSATGSLAYYFMDWRYMTEILSAGQEASSGGIEQTSGTIQERMHSLVQVPKETSLPSIPRQNPLR
jgi:hypothetical protein